MTPPLLKLLWTRTSLSTCGAANSKPPQAAYWSGRSRVLEEPEAHLGRAVVGEAVEAEVDDQVADVVVAGVEVFM